jgi:hypothetical protein
VSEFIVGLSPDALSFETAFGINLFRPLACTGGKQI